MAPVFVTMILKMTLNLASLAVQVTSEHLQVGPNRAMDNENVLAVSAIMTHLASHFEPAHMVNDVAHVIPGGYCSREDTKRRQRLIEAMRYTICNQHSANL